ncbi:glycosyltransferase family 4 protein [Haloferula sargassicola]|uniref:Mannosylfructose-phosphate synthase n=1 Tax=Haloferula sargassicola TaxID=490096 RepID=A0ABP9UL29_9BACT
MKAGLTATMIQGGRSGVAQYVFSLVRELIQRRDLELKLFALEDELPLFDFAKDACEIVPVPRAAAPPVKNILWHQLELPKLARRMKLDVLHVPSYRRLVHHAPCPTVGTIHDLAPFHVRGKYDVARMFYGRVVVKQLARRQKELIAVSHCTARDIERFFGIPQAEIEVVHNGIDHDRFQPGDADADRAWIAEKHGIEAPFFLYISRLEHPAKNHVRLIEAFNQFKQQTGSDWQLALGGGDWHGAEFIHAAAKASPFSGDIRFLGFVPDADLPAIYRAARGMVYPSLFEGFGLPPVEAMACGTPVISSSRGALEEVVADAALCIDPEDVADMAQALTDLVTTPEMAASLRERGLANAKRFDWAIAAEKVAATYARAI